MQLHAARVSQALVNEGEFGKIGKRKTDLSLSGKDVPCV